MRFFQIALEAFPLFGGTGQFKAVAAQFELADDVPAEDLQCALLVRAQRARDLVNTHNVPSAWRPA